MDNLTAEARLNLLLEKISTEGMNSLLPEELSFLDSWSRGEELIENQRICILEQNNIIEDDLGMFRFELYKIKKMKKKRYIFGAMYVPDLILSNGQKITGKLEGKIIDYGGGKTSPDFFKLVKKNGRVSQYDIFEFCNGIEYELDLFIDSVIERLDK